jgi:hypothetical protein
MVESNPRGAVRTKPDPLAIATKGMKTTYEPRNLRGILRCSVKPKISARFRGK